MVYRFIFNKKHYLNANKKNPLYGSAIYAVKILYITSKWRFVGGQRRHEVHHIQ